MVEVLDEEGNLFGVVNVVDALVVLVVVAVLVAGASLVLGTDTNSNNEAITVEYKGENLQPYVVNAISEGNVTSGDAVRIHDKSVTASQVIIQDQAGNLSIRQHPINQTVTLRLGLNVTVQNGAYVYDNQPLEIGRELTLDLGETTITGEVVAMEPADSSSQSSRANG